MPIDDLPDEDQRAVTPNSENETRAAKAPGKRRGLRPSGTKRKKQRAEGEARLAEYARKLKESALQSHPLQEMEAMNVEDERVPIPVPVATRQAETQQAGTSASAEKRSGGEPTTEDSSEDDSDVALKMAKVLSAFAAFTGKHKTSNNASREQSIDMTKVINKPSNYDGISKYHEWKNEIQIYLRVMNFPAHKEASVVLSYLKVTALSWWLQKSSKFKTDGVEVPKTWDQLMPYLDERFEHSNPELAARDKLMGLRQNSLTLHQYLKEFEGCYAYIPKWDEADKIHRFTYGLKPYYKSKFCVDPATHARWISFDALVAYMSSFVADDATSEVVQDASGDLRDLVQKALGAPSPRQAGKPRPTSKKWQHKKLNAVLGRLSEADRSVLTQALKGRVTKKFGSANRMARYKNANGQAVERTKHVRTFCHRQEQPLCLGCYQPGHFVADCTSPVMNGVPVGYQAPPK